MPQRIIASTPILIMRRTLLHTPYSVPHRFVLVERTNDMHSKFCKYPGKGQVSEYVVWTETFYENDYREHMGFHSGEHFPVCEEDSQLPTFHTAYCLWLKKAQSIVEYVRTENFKVA